MLTKQPIFLQVHEKIILIPPGTTSLMGRRQAIPALPGFLLFVRLIHVIFWTKGRSQDEIICPKNRLRFHGTGSRLHRREEQNYLLQSGGRRDQKDPVRRGRRSVHPRKSSSGDPPK